MKKLNVIRKYDSVFTGATNYVLFEKPSHKFKLCLNIHGYFFTDGIQSNYIVIFDNVNFTSDYLDYLPKYIVNFFTSLLKIYGKDTLKEYQRNLLKPENILL